MSIPVSTCLLTTSAIPSRMSAVRVCWSYGLLIVRAFIPSMIARVRMRLPLCVVRMRSVLLFTSLSVCYSFHRLRIGLLILLAHLIAASTAPVRQYLVKVAQWAAASDDRAQAVRERLHRRTALPAL